MIVTIFTGNIGSVKPVAQVGDSKVLNFTVAADKHFTAKNGDKITETTWFECALWNREKVFPFLTKGTQVTIQGTFQQGLTSTKKMLKKLLLFLLVLLIQLSFKVKQKLKRNKLRG